MRRVRQKKKLKKKSMANKKSKILALPAGVIAARKRRSIDVAIPRHKLWICKLGKAKIAFIKSAGCHFPLGLLVKKRKRKMEVVVSVRPFDSTEHEHVVTNLCLHK